MGALTPGVATFIRAAMAVRDVDDRTGHRRDIDAPADDDRRRRRTRYRARRSK